MTNSKNNPRQPDSTRSNKSDKQGKNNLHGGKNSQRPDTDEEPVTESGSDMDSDENIRIGDDPEQTKKKIPQMRK